MTPRVRIAPSILSADFASLATEIARVEPQTDWLHVDVMDGHFVPNLTIGPPVVAAIRHHTRAFLDCHLMMSDPGRYLQAFADAGADGCTVHAEVDASAQLIAQMRDLGLQVGMALNPETPFEACEPWLDRLDLLLVMTVHPGFGGQSFIAEALDKVRSAREHRSRFGLDLSIEVDGGIGPASAALAASAGADTFVAGSAIFAAEDPLAAAAIRKSAEEEYAPR